MPLPIEEMIREYLRNRIDLSEVRDWLARFQWDLDRDRKALADELDVALAQMDDGHVTEADVRSYLGGVLENYFTPSVRITYPEVYGTSVHARTPERTSTATKTRKVSLAYAP
ncbi:MAG: hypothetical protein HY685_01445 [Chloroflexi bacterium]|nr:hypothetical protein [Chloroflexota bacterium]